MVFVKKLSLLPCALFWQTKAKKGPFFNIQDRKEYFLEQKHEFSKMCKKSEYFNGVSPWILSKKRSFYHVCFFWQTKEEKIAFYSSG